MRFQSIDPEMVIVPVLVTVFIAVPHCDAVADGDGGKSFAKEIVRDLEMHLGGVPVKARPLDCQGVAAMN